MFIKLNSYEFCDPLIPNSLNKNFLMVKVKVGKSKLAASMNRKLGRKLVKFLCHSEKNAQKNDDVN